MLLKVGAVLGERLDKLLLPQDGLREEFQQLVLQSVLLAFKVCLDQFQLCDLCVQFRVLDDAGIAGGKRLDLSVAQCVASTSSQVRDGFLLLIS